MPANADFKLDNRWGKYLRILTFFLALRAWSRAFLLILKLYWASSSAPDIDVALRTRTDSGLREAPTYLLSKGRGAWKTPVLIVDDPLGLLEDVTIPAATTLGEAPVAVEDSLEKEWDA